MQIIIQFFLFISLVRRMWEIDVCPETTFKRSIRVEADG